MNLTEEQLKSVEEMAGLFFSPEQIAINLEFSDEDTEAFEGAIDCKNIAKPSVAAYFKGRLSMEVALRHAIKQSAINGSSPSQQMMLNFLKESGR